MSIMIETFQITVDYNLTVEEMIVLAGYRRISDNITNKTVEWSSELTGKQITNLAKLFYYENSVKSEFVIADMKKSGFRPATLAEHLAFMKTHIHLADIFPIVTLEYFWSEYLGEYFAPVSDNWKTSRGRCCFLNQSSCDWPKDCRFLAIKQQFKVSNN